MRSFVPAAFFACAALVSVSPAEARTRQSALKPISISAAERSLFDRAGGDSSSSSAYSNTVKSQPLSVRAGRYSYKHQHSRYERRSRQSMSSADITGSVTVSAERSASLAPAQGGLHAKVRHYAAQHGVPAELAHGVVMVESRYNPRATGPGGYIGLMQLSYRTAQGMGYRGSRAGLYDPDTNLTYGMKYLAGAYRQAGGSMCGAISKYQGGHGVQGVTRAGAVYCGKVRRFIAQGVPKGKSVILASN